LMVLAPYVIILLYGESFREAIILAEILLMANVFMDSKRVLGALYLSLDIPQYASLIDFIGLLLTVVLLVFLLPKMGILGAAIISLIVYFFTFMLMLIYIIKYRGNLKLIKE
ncbi:MAG: polysaccharide biosynthesis C-terminal domain-containing protein, partial [Bacteroidota bacterium]